MSEKNALNTENILIMTLDMMRDIEKYKNYSGQVKKKIVLEKLEDTIGDDFQTYKVIFESIIDGIIIIARNKKVLSNFNKIKYCC